MIEHSIQLLKVLSRGQSRFIRVALVTLPLVLTFVLYSFFITQNLVDAFEKHMHKSYFGVFGDLQLLSSPALLNAVYNAPELASLNRSYRVSTQSVLLFESQTKDVLKGVNILAYETNYLINKFNSENVAENYQEGTIILSTVVFNQLNAGEHMVKAIFNPLTKQTARFNQQMRLDFGFLGSQPIIVMSLADLQKLYTKKSPTLLSGHLNRSSNTITSNKSIDKNTTKTLSYNQIEFNGLSATDIDVVKRVANRILKQGVATDYQLINQKTLTQESRRVFSRVNAFKSAFFFVLISISFAIYFLALRVLLNTKKEALSILQCLGVSNHSIVMTLIFVIAVVTFVCLLLAQQLALLSTASFIQFIGINL